MKFFLFLGLCLLVGGASAAESTEDSDEVANSTTSSNEANFVVLQNSEEALKVEPLEETIVSRFDEGPEFSIPEEQGDAFQGDMILTEEQRKEMFDTSIIESRTGLLADKYRWPKNSNGNPIVPYVVDNRFSAAKKKEISQAMRNIERVSCVRFKARKTQANYVNIQQASKGCNSQVGNLRQGAQSMQLGNDCFKVGTIMHELIHALGYTHMHNHARRDEFVKIHWDRIDQGRGNINFRPVNVREYGNFETAYDFASIMHYPPRSFPISGLARNLATIEPVKKYERYRNVMGNREKLTSGDIKRINNMYKCAG